MHHLLQVLAAVAVAVPVLDKIFQLQPNQNRKDHLKDKHHLTYLLEETKDIMIYDGLVDALR